MRLIIKICRKILFIIIQKIETYLTFSKLWFYQISIGKNPRIYGVPIIEVKNPGSFTIGDCFTLNNGIKYNRIGRQQRSIFIVGKDAHLIIGNNVGISASALICFREIIIEDNVKIGGNCCIYDTDFHSLDANERVHDSVSVDKLNNKPVRICCNAFIGAHSTILKGVTIGENSIIGACSTITKDIPPNQIWAGNPAKIIRSIV